MSAAPKAETRARLEAMAAEATTTPLNISDEARELARLAHTPGPWVWDRSRLRPAKPDPETSAVHTILDDYHGGCGYIGSAPQATHDELEADLALIAAAPDMLAVLIELRESASYWSEYDVPLGIVCRINDAINKATGAAMAADAAKVAA